MRVASFLRETVFFMYVEVSDFDDDGYLACLTLAQRDALFANIATEGRITLTEKADNNDVIDELE